MLSFLCYNAFYDNGIIFIDEPELSLHVDWQRRLFDILIEQGNQNQLFVATHSPFIYSQFPDKELILDYDKGGE
ncbi:MAG: AAA family ATPase, partial [Candidatus Parabeggiatoa sp.]|nr:AAA family ATPase [Candidatus Parabeggiatoa sp.]